MRVLVFGAGAIGSVLGGFLAEAGHDVTLLGRPWHLEVIRREGLRITGLWGDHHLPAGACLWQAGRHRLSTAASVEELPAATAFDWILLCVKAHQTAEAANSLPRALGPQTLLCACQNGLGNYETLIRTVDPDRVALGRVIFGVELSPGAARVTVCADDMVLGAPARGFPRERLSALAEALRFSGIPCRTTESIWPVLWAKVLYNCALNGLSTVLEVPYGALLAQPGASRLMPVILEEAYRVAAAHEVRLEPASASAYLERLRATLIPATASHLPSMLQDLRRGKPTEIEAMNGAIVRLAGQVNLPAPANALVTRLVHAKEQFTGVGQVC